MDRSIIMCAVLGLSGFSVVGCDGGDPAPTDAGGGTDAGVTDGGTQEVDAGPTDAGPDRWACLGETPSTPTPPTPLIVRARIAHRTATGDEPIEGATVRICTEDPCEGDIVGTSDAEGNVDVELTDDGTVFIGYGEVEAEGYLPSIVQANVPTTGRLERRLDVYLVTEADAGALATALGGDLDLDRAQLLLATWDCALEPAPGVSATVSSADAETLPTYLGAAANATATGELGAFVALNVPAGDATVNTAVGGTPAATGTIHFRAGWLTTVVAVPNQ